MKYVHKEADDDHHLPAQAEHARERRDMNWLFNNMESFKNMSVPEQTDVLREALEAKCLAKGVNLETCSTIFQGKGIVEILTLLDNDEKFSEELLKLGVVVE